ncbi:MAG: hypothetical protein HY696_06655 [Deltaproteobacteria bacterium]|nr:hypothetical protein [Deltaproteobacteria bacterium]
MKKSLFAFWALILLGGVAVLLRGAGVDFQHVQHSLARMTGYASGWPPPDLRQEEEAAAASFPLRREIFALLAVRTDDADGTAYRAGRAALMQRASDHCCEAVIAQIRTILATEPSTQDDESLAEQWRSARTMAMSVLVQLPDEEMVVTLKETIEQLPIVTSDYFEHPQDYLNVLALKRQAVRAMARIEPLYLPELLARVDLVGLNEDVRSALIESYIGAESHTPLAAIDDLRAVVAPERQQLLDEYETHYRKE